MIRRSFCPSNDLAAYRQRRNFPSPRIFRRLLRTASSDAERANDTTPGPLCRNQHLPGLLLG